VNFFNCLPVAAVIGDKIFAVHGGISPDLVSMEQIRRVLRPTGVSFLLFLSTFSFIENRASINNNRFPRVVFCAIYYGRTLTLIPSRQTGMRAIVASRLNSVQMLSLDFFRSMIWT
jgi:hypothetical protein